MLSTDASTFLNSFELQDAGSSEEDDDEEVPRVVYCTILYHPLGLITGTI